MAGCDYLPCAVCGKRVIYDAELDYDYRHIARTHAERSKQRISGLEMLLADIEKDLFLRADEGKVQLSHSIWLRLKKANKRGR
jgi:hypothetical protein